MSSSTAVGAFEGVTAPARIRDRSMRLPITRLRRPGLLVDRLEQLPAIRALQSGDSSSSKLETEAVIEASGVRRSWVTDEKSAARSRFVSASIRASSASDPSRMPSIARAIWVASVWITPRSSVVSTGCVPFGTATMRPSSRSCTAIGMTSSRPPSTLAARALRDDRPVRQLTGDLASREIEQLQDRASEALEHLLGGHPGTEPGAQMVEQPGLALPALGPGALFEDAGQHGANGGGDREEHRERHEVGGLLHRERVERRREEEVQREEGAHRCEEARTRARPPPPRTTTARTYNRAAVVVGISTGRSAPSVTIPAGTKPASAARTSRGNRRSIASVIQCPSTGA